MPPNPGVSAATGATLHAVTSLHELQGPQHTAGLTNCVTRRQADYFCAEAPYTRREARGNNEIPPNACHSFAPASYRHRRDPDPLAKLPKAVAEQQQDEERKAEQDADDVPL